MDVDGRRHVNRRPGRKEQDGRRRPRKGLWRQRRPFEVLLEIKPKIRVYAKSTTKTQKSEKKN